MKQHEAVCRHWEVLTTRPCSASPWDPPRIRGLPLLGAPDLIGARFIWEPVHPRAGLDAVE